VTATGGLADRRLVAGGTRTRQRERRRWRWWPVVVLAVLGAATAFVLISRMRPSYDGFGFLVWGKQVLHWNLNTDGAPSWKPLPFLFTLPYALFGHVQMTLWMVTAVAGAGASAVFAARIAFRLVGPSPGRAFAPYVGALFAGCGVLGVDTLTHLLVIANSDALIVAACLGAIDAHQCRRPRLAFGMLLLASFGRPEAWAFAGLYAIWAWRAVPTPSMRALLLVGLFLIPFAWFSVPALTSKSWFISGDLALNQKTVIHGNKIIGVFSRLRSLYELPMQLAVLAGLGVGWLRRDRETLVIAAAAGLWVVVEIGFAFHGWSAVSRYMIEPASMLVVIGGVAVGRMLQAFDGPRLLRLAAPVAALALIVGMVPIARNRARILRGQVEDSHVTARTLDRLNAVIDEVGGPARIRACGQPASLLGYQSSLAWYVGINVGEVSFHPGRSIQLGKPVVLFKPYDHGWKLSTWNIAASDPGGCKELSAQSAFG
jgi:hypothetical protein